MNLFRRDAAASNGTSTVSWQSAFWGLAPLGVNTFLQDIGTGTGTNALYQARHARQLIRISPMVCIAEAIWIVFCFCALWVQKQTHSKLLLDWKRVGHSCSTFYRRANSVAAETSRRQGLEIEERDRIPAVARALPALLAFVQLVKLTGMKGIPFTITCAWFYFVGFGVVELLRTLATSARRDDEPKPADTTLWTSTRAWASGVWVAIMGVPDQRPASSVKSDPDSSALPRWEMLKGRGAAIGRALLGVPTQQAQPAQVDAAHVALARRRVMAGSILFLAALLVQAVITYTIIFRLTKIGIARYNPVPGWGVKSPTFKLTAWFSMCSSIKTRQYIFVIFWGITGTVFATKIGGFEVFVCANCLIGLYFYTYSLVANYLLSLKPQEPGIEKRTQWMLRSLAFGGISMAFGYYTVLYDGSGTVKPSWAEKLG